MPYVQLIGHTILPINAHTVTGLPVSVDLTTPGGSALQTKASLVFRALWKASVPTYFTQLARATLPQLQAQPDPALLSVYSYEMQRTHVGLRYYRVTHGDGAPIVRVSSSGETDAQISNACGIALPSALLGTLAPVCANVGVCAMPRVLCPTVF